MNPGTSVADGTLTVTLNDETRAVPVATTLAALVAELGWAERKGVAVAINGDVVARSAWPTRPLCEGDRVLVIRATQGG